MKLVIGGVALAATLAYYLAAKGKLGSPTGNTSHTVAASHNQKEAIGHIQKAATGPFKSHDIVDDILNKEMPIDGASGGHILQTSPYGLEFDKILGRNNIKLTGADLIEARRAYIRLRERETVLDTALADVASPAPGKCVLTIPPHANESEELQNAYLKSISDLLTEDDAVALVAATQAGQWLSESVPSQSRQQITLNTTENDVPPGDVQVVVTVKEPTTGDVLTSSTSLVRIANLPDTRFGYLAPYVPN